MVPAVVAFLRPSLPFVASIRAPIVVPLFSPCGTPLALEAPPLLRLLPLLPVLDHVDSDAELLLVRVHRRIPRILPRLVVRLAIALVPLDLPQESVAQVDPAPTRRFTPVPLHAVARRRGRAVARLPPTPRPVLRMVLLAPSPHVGMSDT